LEFSGSLDSFSPDYQWENELFFDNECRGDIGESPVHDYLLDQEIGRVSLKLSPDLPMCQRVPYKEMPKFGDDKFQSPISVTEAMECEEVETSRIDSPPALASGTAVTSPPEAPVAEPVPSTQSEEATPPTADNFPASEGTRMKGEPAYQQLALPQVLTEQPH